MRRLGSSVRALVRRLRGQGSPPRLAFSVAIGLFIGCLPLYGFHLTLCLLICVPLRLDALVAYLAANISNPLLAPLLLFAELQLGSWILRGKFADFDLESARHVGPAGLASQLGLGSVVLGLLLGAVGFAVSWLVAARGKPSEIRFAQRRTRERYARSRMADRCYVTSKLALDPVFGQLAELGHLGSVLDAACGRGQLGIALLELGRVDALRGFDFDASRVRTAGLAARGDAQFEVGDLTTHPLGGCDTLLLIDVLHYLPLRAQNELLARAARSLGAGSRLLLRDIDGVGVRALFTRWFEQVAVRTGYNRARSPLVFRSTSELVRELEALGCDCTLLEPRGALSNRLVVARVRAGGRPQASSNSLQNSR